MMVPSTRLLPRVVIALSSLGFMCDALADPARTYNYFAFGSNMASSTMINLRNLTPLASSAAVLPGHRLAFSIPGLPGVEPSSAAVEPVESTVLNNEILDANKLLQEEAVHGVLYKLSEKDFTSVCQTEGVPLAYVLHRCRVIPYSGDGDKAGEDRFQNTILEANANNQSNSNDWGVPAFTLRAARKEWRQGKDIPPSQSYLNVLLRGANEFALDEKYVSKLKSTPVGKTWLGGGVAEEMLRRAEQRKGFSPF